MPPAAQVPPAPAQDTPSHCLPRCLFGTEQMAWKSNCLPAQPLALFSGAVEENNVKKYIKKKKPHRQWVGTPQLSSLLLGALKCFFRSRASSQGGFPAAGASPGSGPQWGLGSPLPSDARWGRGPPCQRCSLGHVAPQALQAGSPGDESAVLAEKMWFFFFFFCFFGLRPTGRVAMAGLGGSTQPAPLSSRGI